MASTPWIRAPRVLCPPAGRRRARRVRWGRRRDVGCRGALLPPRQRPPRSPRRRRPRSGAWLRRSARISTAASGPRGAVGHCLPPRRPRAGRAPRPGADRRRPRAAARGLPAARVPVSAAGEGGLLGIAVDPEFAGGQRFVYLDKHHLLGHAGPALERARQPADARRGRPRRHRRRRDPQLRAPALRPRRQPLRAVATGDAGEGEQAQDEGSRNGKILWLSPDQYRGSGAPGLRSTRAASATRRA